MDRLLHYDLAEKLGESKNGSTFLAMDTGLQRGVVIKLLDHPSAASDDWRSQFMFDMQRLDKVGEEQIARFYSLEEAEGQWFIVREYIEGRSIDELIRTGPVAYSQVIETALELVTGLTKLHQIGLTHGNITPTNVFIDSKSRVRLTDCALGLPYHARAADQPGLLADIACLAPELLEGGELSISSDHYALGALLYQMLTGQPPFFGDDRETLARAISQEPVSFEIRPEVDIPGVARLLVGKLLAKEPEDRFVSTEELLFTIQGMMSLGTEAPILVGKQKWSPTPRQYAMISVLVLLLVILWLVATTGNP